MTTIYIGETGYSGEDLLAPGRPAFAQATHDFTDSETDALLGACFGRVAAKELKFSRLAGSLRHRNRVVALVGAIANDPDRAGFWVSDKEFALFTAVVDWWVEPLAYQLGSNFYEENANIVLANVLYAALDRLWYAGFRRRLLELFQHMLRARTQETYDRCQAFVRLAYQRATGLQAEVLRFFWAPFPLLGYPHLLELPRRVLDLALPGLAYIGHAWRSRRDGPLQAIHDGSTDMVRQRWLCEAVSPPAPARPSFAYRRGQPGFAMNVVGTRFADAVQIPQLQICDILAGSAICAMQTQHRDRAMGNFARRLFDAGIETLLGGGLRPSPDLVPKGLRRRGLRANRAIARGSARLRGAVA